MTNIYEMSVDRRTVYGAVEALNLFGYDISTFEENGKGYFLRTREFEQSEIRLLMDRVYSLNYIPEKQTADLLSKLQNGLSIHQRKQYRNLTIARSNKKTGNKEVFYNIELLDEAISKGVKVEFEYLEYNLDKKLVPKRDMKYIINPYRMVCANERYYLVCNYDKYDNISHYRIDFITNIKLLDEKVKPLPKDFDIVGFSNRLIYMFGGERETVEIICENFMITEIIDRFGSDARICKFDDKHLKLTLNVPPRGIKFWALQYLQYCEVIKPLWLREEIVQSVKNNRYNKKI